MTSKHGQPSLSPPSPSRKNQAASHALTGSAEPQAAPGVLVPETSSSGHIPPAPAPAGPHTVPHTPDSGDRTRPLDLIRATALAMRDLAEGAGVTDATFTLEGGALLTWSTDDGFHLLLPDGTTHDLDEWVDHVDFVLVDGVESVRQQPELMARGSS